MRFPPYVGITGFMRREEVEVLLENTDPELFGGRRQLMVGVLVSSKTMAGLPNRWPGRYPKIEEISGILTDSEYCTNIIHFNTDNPGDLAKDLVQLMEIGGPNCHGVQLNVRWPDPQVLADFKEKFERKRIILQLGRSILNRATWNTTEFQASLERYLSGFTPIIDDILYDPSGGHGRTDWAPDETLNFFRKLKSLVFPHVGLGFAGGLCAEKLPNYRFLFDEFRMILSIDIEGAVRTPKHDPPTSSLNIYKAYAYLIGALSMFYPGVYL